MSNHDGLASRIANEIAGLISTGEIGPHSRLNTQKLADRFAVSRTPVREALALLERTGVVEQQPNRGYFTTRKAPPVSRSRGQKTVLLDSAPDAYYRLAEDWLRDAVPESLTEQYLKERYGLTKAQLSNVLSRAVSEGWMERKTGYGWRLLPVAKTPEAMEQIYRFRLAIEPIALLEPTFRLNHDIVTRLRSTLQTMLDGAIDTWPTERLHGIGVEFHEELIKMSGNPFFAQALARVNRLRELLEYRSMVDRKRLGQETVEHLEILELAMKGELVEASYAMRRHIGNAILRKRPRQRGM